MFNERIHKDPNQHLTVINTLSVSLGGTGVVSKEQAQQVLDVLDESTLLTPNGLAIMPEDEQLGVCTQGGAGSVVTVRGPTSVFANTTTVFTISNFDINTGYFISCDKGEVWRDMAQLYLKVGSYVGELVVTINNTSFSVEAKKVEIKKPAPLNLEDRQINVGSNFILRMSPYNSESNTTFHKSSDWQLSKDPSFNEVVVEVKNSTDALLSWPVTQLEPDTQYYVRSKYRDNAGNESDWGDTVAFHTRESFAPLTPAVQLPAFASNRVGSSVVIESSDFETTEVGSTHASSDWELSTSAVFNGTISDSAKDQKSLTDWHVKGLSENTEYYVRVRYTDDKGRVSQWGPTHNFKTRVSFGANTPHIDSPTTGVTEQNSHVDVSSSAFDHDEAGVTHASSDWEVSEDATFAYPQFKSYSDGQALKQWTVDKLKSNCQYYVRVRYRDNNGSVSDWSRPVVFKTKMSFAPRKPSIVFPAHNATDGTYAMNFRSDIFVSGDLGSTHHSTDWELATNSAFTNVVKSAMQSMNNKTSWSVNRLESTALYFLRVKYRSISSGVLYESDWSDVVSFSVKDIAPGVPGIMTPVNGLEVDYQGQLGFTASAFVEGMPGESHASSDWQMSLIADFSTIFETVNASTAYKTNWAVTGLDAGQTYYIRVKYRANTGRQSSWSAVTSIKTREAAQAVVPLVTSPNDGTLNAATESIRFTCSAFDIVLDGDSHESSDWELAAEPNFQSTLESSYASTNNKTSWLVYGLAYATQFYVRVRHRGSKSGDTRWSAAVKFTTRAMPAIKAPGTPEIVYPVDGSSKNTLAPTVRASSFYSENQGDVHLNSDWELATDPSFDVIEKSIYTSVGYKTTWSLTDLFANTVYYVRVRYRGSVGGQSEWSYVQTFKTGLKTISGGVAGTGVGEVAAAKDPSKPKIKYPTLKTNEDIPTTVSIVAEAFKSASGDVHKGSKWVLKDADNKTVVQETEVTSVYKIAWPLENLEQDTTYNVSVMFIGEEKGESVWSEPQKFTTELITSISKPAVVFPTEVGKKDGLVCVASPFTSSKEDVLHTSSDWELFGEGDVLVFNKYDDTTNKTELPLGSLFSGLIVDKKYSLRVRYKGRGAADERSKWSGKTTFKITDADVTLPPVILKPSEGAEIPAHPFVEVMLSGFASTSRELGFLGMEIQLSATESFDAETTVTHLRYKDNYINGIGEKTLYFKPFQSSGDLFIRAKYFGTDNHEPNWSLVRKAKFKIASRPSKQNGSLSVKDVGGTDTVQPSRLGPGFEIEVASVYFGYSIALNKDGDSIVIGDPACASVNPQPPFGGNSSFRRGCLWLLNKAGDVWNNRFVGIASGATHLDENVGKGLSIASKYHGSTSWWGDVFFTKRVAYGTIASYAYHKYLATTDIVGGSGTTDFNTNFVIANYSYDSRVGDTNPPLPRVICDRSWGLGKHFIPAESTSNLQKKLKEGRLWTDNGYVRLTPVGGSSLSLSRNDMFISLGIASANTVFVTGPIAETGHVSQLTESENEIILKKGDFYTKIYDFENPKIKTYELRGEVIDELDCEALTAGSYASTGACFGISSALNEAGDILYVGCLGRAQEYVEDGTGTCGVGHVLKYQFKGSKWELVGMVSGRGYGMSVACDSTGDTFVTGGFKEVTLQYLTPRDVGIEKFPLRPHAKIGASARFYTGTMVYGKFGGELTEVPYIGEPDSNLNIFQAMGSLCTAAGGIYSSARPGSPYFSINMVLNSFAATDGEDPRCLRRLGIYGNRGWDVTFGKKVAMTDAGVPVSCGRDYIMFDSGFIPFSEVYPARDLTISGNGKQLAISTGVDMGDTKITFFSI